MSGRTLMWILRAAAFGLFALYLLARFVFVDPRAIYMVGAIGMGAMCIYSTVGARASSKDDENPP